MIHLIESRDPDYDFKTEFHQPMIEERMGPMLLAKPGSRTKVEFSFWLSFTHARSLLGDHHMVVVYDKAP